MVNVLLIPVADCTAGPLHRVALATLAAFNEFNVSGRGRGVITQRG